MVNATNFDGSTDFFTRGGGLTGAVDGGLGILSMWLKPSDFETDLILINANSTLVIQKFSAFFRVFAANPSAASRMDLRSTIAPVLDTWQHILMSWDTSLVTPAGHVYIDDTDRTDISASATGADIDYTSTDWFFGRNVTAGNYFTGCVSEFYFNSAEFLDFSVEANRRKFITAGLGPVDDLGADGSDPTGTAPSIYFPNAFGSFGTNPGAGGNFTEDAGSSVVACADVPGEPEPPPALTPGLALKPFVLPDGRRFADEGEARVEYARLMKEEALIRARLEAEKREAARLLAIEMAKPRLPDKDWKLSPRQKPEPPPKPAKSRQSLLDPLGWPRLYKD